MATYKADHLKEMIRQVVREEIRGVISQTISEVFAERYLKNIVESAVAARPRGVNNLSIMGDDEEEEQEIPEPLANTILGVGQEDPVFKKVPKSDGVKQFSEGKDRNEMLSLFFKDTTPFNSSELAADDHAMEGAVKESVAPPTKEESRMTEVWKTLAGVDKPAAPAPVANVADLEKREESRLKMLRERLEVPANR